MPHTASLLDDTASVELASTVFVGSKHIVSPAHGAALSLPPTMSSRHLTAPQASHSRMRLHVRASACMHVSAGMLVWVGVKAWTDQIRIEMSGTTCQRCRHSARKSLCLDLHLCLCLRPRLSAFEFARAPASRYTRIDSKLERHIQGSSRRPRGTCRT